MSKTFELWNKYFQDAGLKTQYQDNFDEFLDNLRKEEERKACEKFQPWLSLLEDSIQWLGNIWAILHRKISDEESDVTPLLRSTWSLLSSSINHAVAVRSLVISGLDNPARGAARILDEYLCTCIAVLNNPDIAEGFQAAQSPEEASQFWYENFNTKKLKKHLNNVERSVGLEGHISHEFREWRDHELNGFSQVIHPTFVAGVMASGIYEPEDSRLGIFGKLSAASERTLVHACKAFWYFSCFGFMLLFNEHNGVKPLIEFDKNDEMHQMALIGREVIQTINREHWE